MPRLQCDCCGSSHGTNSISIISKVGSWLVLYPAFYLSVDVLVPRFHLAGMPGWRPQDCNDSDQDTKPQCHTYTVNSLSLLRPIEEEY